MSSSSSGARRFALLCAALLGLSALIAAAQRQAGFWALFEGSQQEALSADCSCGLEAALERAQELDVPALILIARGDLPLAALQLELLEGLSGRQRFALGQADHERHGGLVHEVLARPAALALLVLDPAGVPLAARAGFVQASEVELLLLQAEESLPQLDDMDLSQVELARELLERGLEARGQRLLRELLEADLPAAAASAAREVQLREQLARGEVRDAQANLDRLAAQRQLLSPGDWAYDRAACAFARRELARALELLSTQAEKDLPCASRILKARVLHELGRDAAATQLLEASGREELTPIEELRLERTRRHLLEDPHGHDH